MSFIVSKEGPAYIHLYHEPCFLRQKCFCLVHYNFHFDTLPLCFFVLVLSSHSLVFVNTSNVLHVLNIWIEIFYSPNIVPVPTDPLMNSQVPVVHIKRSLEKQTNKQIFFRCVCNVTGTFNCQ